MPRLITILWMTILWMIAVVAGATFYYGLNTGLGSLAVIALILAVLAFAASLLPLSRSFLSELGVAPSPTADISRINAERPAPNRLVHEAGMPQADRQTCVRCGTTVCDFTAPHGSRTGWAAGTHLVESDGTFSTLDGKVVEDEFCSPIRNRLWSVTS
ncbi:MAG TPA: hypothetical protein VM784_05050 [Actinomycetota bacterium]|nr:hypothetical protein [Actinomycetota bacterium]